MTTRHFTYEQKRQAIERELVFRRAVYRKKVAARRMRQEDADYQLAVFEAIAADYGRLEGEDRLPLIEPQREQRERFL